MAVVGAIMVPHPPLIVPEVGKGGENSLSSEPLIPPSLSGTIPSWQRR